MKVLVNHMGYSAKGPKKAVMQCTSGEAPTAFRLLDESGAEVLAGTPQGHGSVARWNTGEYWTADFSAAEAEGTYRIEVSSGGQVFFSDPFEISGHLLTMRMLSAVGYYFKAQRDSGEWLEADRALPFQGGREGVVDAHGAWYDATGDYGIHLSHLSHSGIHNPQQAAFSAYAFFKLHEFMTASGNEQYSMVKRRMLDEGVWGADFLMRMRAPGGSFFRSINRKHAFDSATGTRCIGFEYHHSSAQFSAKAATADEETVTDANYEVSLRSGGGLAIAALAIAARHPYPSQSHGCAEYLMAAKRAWRHLEEHNARYTNDGEWNLLDEFCALMAATELYRTSHEYEYLLKARHYSECLRARMEAQGEKGSRLYVSPGCPFHHAADEGMPVVALLQYAEAEPDGARRAAAVNAAEEIMRWHVALTDEVANPFGYPRLEHLDEDGQIKAKFFFPHNSTAAPWWQGDNARIASLAAAAQQLAGVTEDTALAARLARFAQDPLDWIMGLNPFDSCMIEGYGKNNIQYYFENRHDFLNCPGGIVNGVTSGLEDEEGIEFIMRQGGPVTDNWRWAEQWIPHASWYLYAMALKME